MSDEPASIQHAVKPALVLIDMQRAMLRERMVHDVDRVLAVADTMLQAFHENGLPVVLTAWGRTTATSKPDANWFLPEIRLRGDELLVARTTFSAFAGTGVLEHLRSQSVDHLVLAGVATSIGVESSLRDAGDHGFRPDVLLDATTDLALDAHEWTLDRVVPIFGTARSSGEALAALRGRRHRDEPA